MNETDEQEFIDIAILDNIIEAQLVESILNEQNIPHFIRSFHDTAGCFRFKWDGENFAPLFHISRK